MACTEIPTILLDLFSSGQYSMVSLSYYSSYFMMFVPMPMPMFEVVSMSS